MAPLQEREHNNISSPAQGVFISINSREKVSSGDQGHLAVYTGCFFFAKIVL